MPDESLTITFPESSVAEGNRFASTLAEALRDVDSSITVSRQRELLNTQDFGTTLALTLGTAAATAVAKGIASWLARNSGANIEIRRKGELVLTASHLDSNDISKIAKAFSTHV